MIDRIEETLADQFKCRLIQKQLELSESALINRLFYKMLPNIDRYMKMPFGNYLCQRLFERSSEKQLYAVISKTSDCIIDLSKNLHGTRVIQKLIDLSHTSHSLVALFARAFAGHVAELIMVRFG